MGQAITIPLLLNDLKLDSLFLEDSKLIVEDEYSYKDETVILTGSLFEKKTEESRPTIGETVPLRLQFSDGADWEMQVIYVEALS